MTKITNRVLIAAIGAGVVLAAVWYHHGAEAAPVEAANQAADPADPHAAHRAQEYVHGAAPAPEAGGNASPSSVHITAERQQMIGIRVDQVEKKAGTRDVRLLGRVAADESKTFRVNAGINGGIHDVYPFTSGSRVKKNEVLASFVAPDALPSIQLFILNSSAMDRAKLGPSQGQTAADLANANLRQRLDQLENLGLSADQLREIAETELFPTSIRIVSPTDGVILSRNVSPGMKFEKGTEFYRIADLHQVWILADVFESDAASLKPGTHVEFSLPGQTKTAHAVVSSTLPRFDPASRTLKVRLDVDNPDMALLPDMFVDLKVKIPYLPAITVPADAILDAGLKKTVFVESGEGMFTPREVETGWRYGDRVEIVRGLAAGDRIATSGTFLLESETRMRGVAVRVSTADTKPGSGAKATSDPMPMDHSHHHQ